jgi:hypothetical protein
MYCHSRLSLHILLKLASLAKKHVSVHRVQIYIGNPAVECQASHGRAKHHMGVPRGAQMTFFQSQGLVKYSLMLPVSFCSERCTLVLFLFFFRQLRIGC